MEDMDEQLRIIQMYNWGLISRRTAIEKLGYTEDVGEEIRRIEEEEERSK